MGHTAHLVEHQNVNQDSAGSSPTLVINVSFFDPKLLTK